MSQYTIENKTILLPRIIAEGAFWDEIENLPVADNPEKALELQNKIVPALVEKANHLYKVNKHFRSRITSTEKGRNTLWAFMRHWTKGILKIELKNT
jgi:hypothetical protein